MGGALRQVVQAFPKIENVGIESSIFGESWSEGAYALYVTLMGTLFDLGQDVVTFDPTSMKSIAKRDPRIRKGRMDKSDMIMAARADTGIQVWDDNEADAYIVARTAHIFWAWVGGSLTDEDLTPAEASSFTQLRNRKHASKRVFRFSKPELYPPLSLPDLRIHGSEKA